MTRKHFEALAKHICMIADPSTRLIAAIAVAAACQEANPKFNYLRFYEACNVRN